MSSLKEFAYMPKVTVNGKEYIDKELFIRYFRELIQQEHKDCTEEERNGLDISLNILNSLK